MNNSSQVNQSRDICERNKIVSNNPSRRNKLVIFACLNKQLYLYLIILVLLMVASIAFYAQRDAKFYEIISSSTFSI